LLYKKRKCVPGVKPGTHFLYTLFIESLIGYNVTVTVTVVCTPPLQMFIVAVPGAVGTMTPGVVGSTEQDTILSEQKVSVAPGTDVPLAVTAEATIVAGPPIRLIVKVGEVTVM
jgi:hypothetical protein